MRGGETEGERKKETGEGENRGEREKGDGDGRKGRETEEREKRQMGGGVDGEGMGLF